MNIPTCSTYLWSLLLRRPNSKSEIVGIEKVGKVCKEIMTPKTACGEYRNVIVVGHDVAQDIDLILTIDIDVYDLPGLVEIMDNQRMQQHRKRFPNPQGLGGVLTGLEIPHIYLHNAGNDAVYTLQSMLAHSIRMRLDSLGKVPRPKPVFVSWIFLRSMLGLLTMCAL